MVTIRTTIQPGNRNYVQSLVISGDRARFTGEIDHWRLFDTKARTVTFVDDIAKTVRTEPLSSIVEKRRATLDGALPAHFPKAQITNSGARKPMHGVNAEQSVLEVGAYKRELWIGDHPAIPDDLFAMMVASDEPSSPLAPMMRAVDEALLRTKGYPLLDHAEVPYGKSKSVVERTVIGIAQRDVPEALITLPRDYEDLTPKQAPQPSRLPSPRKSARE